MKLTFCAACDSTDDLQHHHLVTRAEGGSDEETNLITLCCPCHLKLHERQLNGVYNHRKQQLEGIAKRKAAGLYAGKGRPQKVDRTEVAKLRAEGMSPTAISKQLKINRATVYRLTESVAP